MSLAALLQLASPALPVGAYSYSQGLESAIDAGIVRDEDTARRWIDDALTLVLARFEAPVWLRLWRAFLDQDFDAASRWNAELLSTRETAELRAESAQMGYSLVQLMRTLGHRLPIAPAEIAYTTAHAWACSCWNIEATPGLTAYLYGWAENQVMVALKTVPLGQSAGQRLLLSLRSCIEDSAQRATQIDDEDLSTQSPMLAVLSSQHETQYSRLFRS